MSTMRACAAEAMVRQEQAFLRLLPKLTRAQVGETTDGLTLSGSTGESLIFRRAAE